MSDQFTIHCISYFSGVLSGLIIKWTDLIPLSAGFFLGFMCNKLPSYISLESVVYGVKNYANYFRDVVVSARSSE